ncbi:MAG: sulfite oxidase [Burkholderiaceae bacterium]
MTTDIDTQTSSNLNLQRRRVLAGGSAALAAAGLAGFSRSAAAQAASAATATGAKPLPPYVAWKNPDAMIVHSANTLETRRAAFGTSIITPNNQLYIRNNVPPPDASIVADRDAWELAVEGVKQPRSFSLRQLKSMGLETVAMVLQCSGNGRGLFPSKPSGTPWQVGAAGCVIWSGVPVRAVAEALGGVASGMVYLTGTGGEKLPAGLDPKSLLVERSVPVAAMADALLAWEMNGEPISLAHGGPLRLIVPGYFGVNNVKYIKRLAFTAEESDAKIQQTRYRMIPPGETGKPSQASVWQLAVKSWINSPSPEAGPVAAGLTQIEGIAFGGMHEVKSVEVSIDGGKSWQAARFVGPSLGRYAWRQFVLAVKLPAGKYQIASRAVDAEGHAQPEQRIENASGYSNTSWRDHALQITVV